jgi:hypothetical protein
VWIAACVAGLAAVGLITDICLAGLDKAAALAGVVVGLVDWQRWSLACTAPFGSAGVVWVQPEAGKVGRTSSPKWSSS